MNTLLRERLTDRSRVLVAGHRGWKARYPENTLLSFEQALRLGVDMLELDLRPTRDGRIVVLHDDTLDRTTNGSGLVREHTLAQIRALDAGGWFAPEFAGLTVPTLEEFCGLLDSWPKVLLNVEFKTSSPEAIKSALRLLREAGLTERCVFTCFDAAVTDLLHDRYGLPTQGFPAERMTRVVPGPGGSESKLTAVGIEMGLLTAERVREYEARGVLPWCYCPDTEEAVRTALSCGARLITANDPEPALRVLGRTAKGDDGNG